MTKAASLLDSPTRFPLFTGKGGVGKTSLACAAAVVMADRDSREVSRTTSETPEAVRNLLWRLRDGLFTRILLVTMAEATPVHEADRLQEDLVRAGIHPFAWVVNQSFAANGLSSRS